MHNSHAHAHVINGCSSMASIQSLRSAKYATLRSPYQVGIRHDLCGKTRWLTMHFSRNSSDGGRCIFQGMDIPVWTAAGHRTVPAYCELRSGHCSRQVEDRKGHQSRTCRRHSPTHSCKQPSVDVLGLWTKTSENPEVKGEKADVCPPMSLYAHMLNVQTDEWT